MLSEKLLSTVGNATSPVYVDDVFSTYLYTAGVSGVTNNIDLSTKGGMVWIKSRSSGDYHNIFDTARGVLNDLRSNTTDSQVSASNTLTAFNTTGFSLGSDSSGYGVNSGGANYASWTFRKQPKFFDVVTWTGDGTVGRNIPHNLGSTPGCVIVKKTIDGAGTGNYPWYVYHRGIQASGDVNGILELNGTDASTGYNGQYIFGVGTAESDFRAPTSTNIIANNNGAINESGSSYVAYLFAHDAGGFGTAGTDNVISCGSFVGTGGISDINLGYEPQWLLFKDSSSGTANWTMMDNMRGWGVASSTTQYLYPNLSNAEANANYPKPTATGFQHAITSGNTCIYIAIRRPMKPPTTGTSVYTSASGNSGNPSFSSSFPVDFALAKSKTSALDWLDSDRLRGAKVLRPNLTDAETDYSYAKFDYMNGWNSYPIDSSYQSWMFKRASTFFDEVCYTGNNVSGRTINHNLTVAPELMIVKQRSGTGNWSVYAASQGATNVCYLNNTYEFFGDAGSWANTAPTSSVFTVGANGDVNNGGSTFVAYLFATVAGVSKVGLYTGNGSTQTINCGFTGGARFVLIKRTDARYYGWYVYDTARGMTSSVSPYLQLNSTSAEQATSGSVTTVSTGFAVNSSALADINISGGSYLYLAIA